jgi:ABC-type amino acid transport substrate-binding protein
MVQAVKNRQADIIGSIHNTAERRKFFEFTDPYVTIPNVIIVSVNKKDEYSIEDLSFKKVAIVKGYATVDYLKHLNPNINVVEVKDSLTALKMVSFKPGFPILGDKIGDN